MLDKVIMFPFSLFLIFLFAFFAVTGMGMFSQWAMVQNQAQYVAASMARYGGYTQEAENAVREFADRLNLSRSAVDVEVNSIGPIPWGMDAEARITIPYRFRVGEYSVGTFNISGSGRAVSTYLGGAGFSYITP